MENKQDLKTELNKSVGLLNSITNYQGLQLAIFGALIAIGGQLTGSGITIVIGIVLLVPGIIREITESTSEINIDKTDMIIIFAMLIFGIVIITKTSYIANFVLLTGFSMVIYGIKKNETDKKDITKVEYRYIPRTFKEEQEEPVKVSNIFSEMFTKPAPFPISGYSSGNNESVGKRRIEEITSPFS